MLLLLSYAVHRCAGIFTGHAALELYAEVFDAAGALDTVCCCKVIRR
jgi:dihydroorotase